MEALKDNGQPPILRAPTHQKYYVTNIRGGATSQDIRFELLNEKIKGEKDEIVFISDALIILTPIAAKRLSRKLAEAISETEKRLGPIPDDVEQDIFI